MSAITQLRWAGGASFKTLLKAIQDASLTTNLKLALDFGSISSWPGSGTQWLDTSGGGIDFDRTGSSGGPVPTGSAGQLGSGNYWTFTGNPGLGRFFTYETTNAAWMETLHKDNAIFSVIVALHSVADGEAILGDNANDLSSVGLQINGANGGGIKPRLIVSNGTGVAALDVAADNAISFSSWSIVGLSINGAGGSVSFFYQNGNYNPVSAGNTFDAAYLLPSAAGAAAVMQIAAAGAGAALVNAAARVAFFGMWQGTALTKANFDSLYASLKPRFGLA